MFGFVVGDGGGAQVWKGEQGPGALCLGRELQRAWPEANWRTPDGDPGNLLLLNYVVGPGFGTGLTASERPPFLIWTWK